MVLLLALEASAVAQEVVFSPGVSLSSTATSNRDQLPSGQEIAEVFATVQGGAGVGVRGSRWALLSQYLFVINQPVAQPGLDQAVDLTPQRDHRVDARLLWQATERLQLELGGQFFVGLNTFRFIEAGGAGLQDQDGAAQAAVSPVLTTRNRFMSFEGGLGGSLQLTARDVISLRGELGMRRDFAAEIDQDEVTLAFGDAFAQDRDTLSLGLRLEWQRQLGQGWDGGLAFENTAAAFGGIGLVTRIYRLELSTRKTLSEVWSVQAGTGGAVTITKPFGVVDPALVNDDPILTGLVSVGTTAQWQRWGLGLGFERGVIDSGEVGQVLLADVVRGDVTYRYDRRFAMRAQGSFGLAQDSFSPQDQQDSPLWTYATGASLLVGVLDWLDFNASYNFIGQFQAESDAQQQNVVNAANVGAIAVHSFLLGFSARADFSPAGRLPDESVQGLVSP